MKKEYLLRTEQSSRETPMGMLIRVLLTTNDVEVKLSRNGEEYYYCLNNGSPIRINKGFYEALLEYKKEFGIIIKEEKSF